MRRYELIIYGQHLEKQLITIDELSRLVELHPAVLRRYIVLGLLDPEIESPEPLFDETVVARVLKIERLKRDLGINAAGCALVLDLLERIQELEAQLAHLQR